ncbi:MAG: alpha/beta hydrolase [Clostridia bacterium]|nr:alpha/beta hydrolase [Clostridia bacterium]
MVCKFLWNGGICGKISNQKGVFPFNHFRPPISRGFLRIAVPFMRVPRFVYKSPVISTQRYEVPTVDGSKIQCLLMSPKGAASNLPCLVYIHGGGFVLPAAGYHYKNAMRYAAQANCRVWFVNYRLAPRHSSATLFDDCYSAAVYLYDNAATLGVNSTQIGIGGDSAGATLAVGVCMMARDKKHPVQFAFQMLPYPFLDMRGTSQSNQAYTDTPMWNSRLSQRVEHMTALDNADAYYTYFSPVEVASFDGLPPAYVETAQFDCLHDDGVLYASLLQQAGIEVVLNQTQGTMHGFDIKQGAPTTQQALQDRVAFIRRYFNN